MMSLFFCLAEGEGFKPPIPEKGIPDFESSAIVHSANLPLLIADAKVLHFVRNQEKYTDFFANLTVVNGFQRVEICKYPTN